MKFIAYKCDGCGKVEKAGHRTRKSYYGSYREECAPAGWVNISIPGKRGVVCSEDCVDTFATNAVNVAIDAAKTKFQKAAKKTKVAK